MAKKVKVGLDTAIERQRALPNFGNMFPKKCNIFPNGSIKVSNAGHSDTSVTAIYADVIST